MRMAKVVDAKVLGEVKGPDEWTLWLYNGMDCMLTLDIFQKLQFVLEDDDVKESYGHAKRMMHVVFDTMKQGMYVDPVQRAKVLALLEDEHFRLSGIKKVTRGAKTSYEVVDEGAVLQRLAIAAWGKPLKYRSSVQLKKFIYEAMGVPVFRQRRGRKWVVGTGHEVLNKIRDKHPSMMVFCDILMYLAELDNGINVVGKTLDPDGRLRS